MKSESFTRRVQVQADPATGLGVRGGGGEQQGAIAVQPLLPGHIGLDPPPFRLRERPVDRAQIDVGGGGRVVVDELAVRPVLPQRASG